MSNIKEKLQVLAEKEGFSSVEGMVEAARNFPLVPAICVNQGCNHSYYAVPEATGEWCPRCKTNSVFSALTLNSTPQTLAS